MHEVDKLTTFMYRMFSNLEISSSWNPQCLSVPVQGLLFLLLKFRNLEVQRNIEVDIYSNSIGTFVNVVPIFKIVGPNNI